ncbi:MAG TPA: hypothetical protein VI911_07405 [Patescibacteria group bacterium]|nr:hypothetical protein [Patescibacteria group bacterium]
MKTIEIEDDTFDLIEKIREIGGFYGVIDTNSIIFMCVNKELKYLKRQENERVGSAE